MFTPDAAGSDLTVFITYGFLYNYHYFIVV